MKRIWLICMILIMSYFNCVFCYTEGIEYIKINKIVPNVPQVIEFFSFYCPHCYQFESQKHVSDILKKSLPKNIKMELYHVDSLGPLGLELSQAWVIAKVLKIEKKVMTLLFNGIQKTNSINSIKDIKDLFSKIGISNYKYDQTLNNVVVKFLIKKEQLINKKFQLYSVPSIYIKGRYLILNNNIKYDYKKKDDYQNSLSKIINFLIKK